MVCTLGFGLANSSAEVASFAQAPAESKGVLMDLHGVLVDVARARHDLNNPLTSALAEVQLLLFDEQDEEARESLEVTQSQLRRMRDLIAATSTCGPHANSRISHYAKAHTLYNANCCLPSVI